MMTDEISFPCFSKTSSSCSILFHSDLMNLSQKFTGATILGLSVTETAAEVLP
jgi:hypothetical protein